jgi:hypothetical protein
VLWPLTATWRRLRTGQMSDLKLCDPGLSTVWDWRLGIFDAGVMGWRVTRPAGNRCSGAARKTPSKIGRTLVRRPDEFYSCGSAAS